MFAANRIGRLPRLDIEHGLVQSSDGVLRLQCRVRQPLDLLQDLPAENKHKDPGTPGAAEEGRESSEGLTSAWLVASVVRCAPAIWVPGTRELQKKSQKETFVVCVVRNSKSGLLLWQTKKNVFHNFVKKITDVQAGEKKVTGFQDETQLNCKGWKLGENDHPGRNS